jgi:hypothetical protein
LDTNAAVWLVIAAAIVAANLPFFSENLFGFIPLKHRSADGAHAKPFWVRLVELLVLYLVVGGLARVLESQIGNVFPQTAANMFYPITGCLFLVLAFPGFVLRYLRKHRHG